MDKLERIFAEQLKLTIAFQNIEQFNNTLHYDPHVPLRDLQNVEVQNHLRVGAWLAIEELGEMLDAWVAFVDSPTPIPGYQHQLFDEMSDIAHFTIEILILSGMTAAEVVLPKDGMDRLDWAFQEMKQLHAGTHFENSVVGYVHMLARAVHYLRGKGWKQNPPLSNLTQYKQSLYPVFYSMIQLANAIGMDANEFLAAYLHKSKVNEGRISSRH